MRRVSFQKNKEKKTWHHWWKKGLQSRFVKAINPGFRNRD
jgi:hypothetical protein